MSVQGQAKKSQLLLIFLTIFIYLAGFGLVIPIIPILAKDFGATAFQVGLLMSIYSLMQFIFSPFWGKLSDQWGRRPILIFCLFGEGLSYLLFAWSRELEWLFVARGLAGFFGGSISTASAYISDVTDEKNRSQGMALIGVAFGLGFLIGPALGGVLTLWGQQISSAPHFSTSFASLFVAGFCFLAALFSYFYLTESLKTPQRKASVKRLVRIFEYINRPIIGTLILAFFLGTLGMASMEATLILLVQEKFSWDLKTISFGFAYIGLVSVFSQGFLVRKLLPLFGEKKMMLMGFLILVVSFSFIGWIDSIFIMAISMTGIAVGNSFVNPAILGSISLIAHSDEQGGALGSAQGTASLGRIIGPALGGYVYQHWAQWSPFLISGVLAMLAFIMLTRHYNVLPQRALEERK